MAEPCANTHKFICEKIEGKMKSALTLLIFDEWSVDAVLRLLGVFHDFLYECVIWNSFMSPGRRRDLLYGDGIFD